MGMNYIRIFADMEEMLETYTDEQRGRLLSAMMAYAFRQEEPSFVKGDAELHVWSMIRKIIDDGRRMQDAKANAGAAGGTAKAESESSKRVAQSSRRVAKRSKKAHEQEQEQEYEQEHSSAVAEEKSAQAHDTPTPADEPVLAFTGEDMREDIKRNELADQLIARYNIQRNEPTREALLEDLEKHGEERMLEVLNTAAFANSRDKLTTQFWRSILANVGKPKPSKGSPPKDYTTRQYTANDYKGMEVDLDAD